MVSTLKGYRWRIVAVLFMATVINYVDRNVLSFTMIDEGFRRSMLGVTKRSRFDEADVNRFKELMGYVDWAFKTAYALGFLAIGYVIDRVGTRKGLSLGMAVWSVAGVLSAFTTGIKSMSSARFLLGLGEAQSFPVR